MKKIIIVVLMAVLFVINGNVAEAKDCGTKMYHNNTITKTAREEFENYKIVITDFDGFRFEKEVEHIDDHDENDFIYANFMIELGNAVIKNSASMEDLKDHVYFAYCYYDGYLYESIAITGYQLIDELF